MKRNILFSFFLILFCLAFSSIVFCADQVASLTWNQELAADLEGWNVYISEVDGDISGVIPIRVDFVSEQPSYTTPVTIDSPNGVVKTWYITVTAFDTSGNESGQADWISFVVDFESPSIPLELLIEIRRV